MSKRPLLRRFKPNSKLMKLDALDIVTDIKIKKTMKEREQRRKMKEQWGKVRAWTSTCSYIILCDKLH